MKLFETDTQRASREADEAKRREDRDAAVKARQRADDAERQRQEEWRRVQEQGNAQLGWRPAALEHSPEAVAARTEAVRLAGEAETERRRQHKAFRDAVVQQAVGDRSAKQSSLAARDLEGYAGAHGRLVAMEALLHELDEGEANRRQMTATPTLVAGSGGPRGGGVVAGRV